MSIPVRHHFLPVFYLQRWTGGSDTEQVFAYYRPRERVVVRRYAPSAVGFKDNLYAIEGREDGADRQEVESKFMSPLDARGAQALAFMLAEGRRPDDKRLRDGWTRFVMSLMYRSPAKVEWLRRRVTEMDAGTLQELSETYQALRVEGDPPTFDEYRIRMGSSLSRLPRPFARMIVSGHL